MGGVGAQVLAQGVSGVQGAPAITVPCLLCPWHPPDAWVPAWQHIVLRSSQVPGAFRISFLCLLFIKGTRPRLRNTNGSGAVQSAANPAAPAGHPPRGALSPPQRERGGTPCWGVTAAPSLQQDCALGARRDACCLISPMNLPTADEKLMPLTARWRPTSRKCNRAKGRLLGQWHSPGVRPGPWARGHPATVATEGMQFVPRDRLT